MPSYTYWPRLRAMRPELRKIVRQQIAHKVKGGMTRRAALDGLVRKMREDPFYVHLLYGDAYGTFDELVAAGHVQFRDYYVPHPGQKVRCPTCGLFVSEGRIKKADEADEPRTP